jgi:hypothetical protein
MPSSGYVYMVRTSMSRESPTTQSRSIGFTPTVYAQCRPPGRSCSGRWQHRACTANSVVRPATPTRDYSFFRCRHAAYALARPHRRACKLCPTTPVTVPRCIQGCRHQPIASALLLPKFARGALGSAFGEQGSRCDGSFRVVVAFLMIDHMVSRCDRLWQVGL